MMMRKVAAALLVVYSYLVALTAVPNVIAFSSTSPSSSTTTTTTSRKNHPRVALQGLDEATFRHTLDRELTSVFKSAPFANVASLGIRQALTVVEQGLRLDLLSSSVKVSHEQLPELQAILEEACQVLDIANPPELYIQSSATANAYTLAMMHGNDDDEKTIIVVTSALVDRCTLPELQAIFGHELGHTKCEHSLYLTLGGLASTPLRNLPVVGRSTEHVLQRWRLAAEYSCDRAALLVAQDARVVNGAMVKLFAGTSRYAMNTDAFVAQCVEYDQLLQSANPLVRASILRMVQSRTHPLPVRRVAELQKWAASEEYARILAKGVALVAADDDADEDDKISHERQGSPSLVVKEEDEKVEGKTEEEEEEAIL